MSLAKSLPLLI